MFRPPGHRVRLVALADNADSQVAKSADAPPQSPSSIMPHERHRAPLHGPRDPQ